MYRVRFHLAKGEHFRMWQVRHPDGTKTYHDPATTQLAMYGCYLRNSRRVADRIHAGANKSVCAWVLCRALLIDGVARCGVGTEVAYDPRVAPHWRDHRGRDIDGRRYRVIVSEGRTLTGQPVERFDCVCCGAGHENEHSLTCESCDSERESGDLELPEWCRD